MKVFRRAVAFSSFSRESALGMYNNLAIRAARVYTLVEFVKRVTRSSYLTLGA